jgi:hypothetical protein
MILRLSPSDDQGVRFRSSARDQLGLQLAEQTTPERHATETETLPTVTEELVPSAHVKGVTRAR